MAVINLFDGTTEFSLEDLDKVKMLCDKDEVPFGYTITLVDERGLTNNSNIEQIVELFINLKFKLMFIVNEKDNFSEDVIEMINSWITSYRDLFRIGLLVKDGKLNDGVFKIKDTACIMPIVVAGDTSIEYIVDLIVSKRMNRLLFLELPNIDIVPYKKITKEIIDSTDYRKKWDVGLWLGCGFTICMFSDEGIGKLFNSPLSSFAFFCSSKVIIKPDMHAYYCSKIDHKIALSELNHIIEAHIKLEEKKLANFAEYCYMDKTCWSYKKTCGGGCLYNK